jgi:hypothetical protein
VILLRFNESSFALSLVTLVVYASARLSSRGNGPLADLELFEIFSSCEAKSSNSSLNCIWKLEPKHCKFSLKQVNCANINKIPRRIGRDANTFGLEYHIAQILIPGFQK